jgi:hypothetical protein
MMGAGMIWMVAMLIVVIALAWGFYMLRASQNRPAARKRKHDEDIVDSYPDALADDDYVDLEEADDQADYPEDEVLDLDEKPKRHDS